MNDARTIVRRAQEAWARGATEVCMQGGIHPDYTGATYLAICRAVKRALPHLHIHAFSPLEVSQGARTLNLGIPEFLATLQEAGLGTLPGTAAEILDDDVRRVICPDKLSAGAWLGVVEAAHGLGLRTTGIAKNAAERLMAMIAFHLSIGNSSTGATCWVPALLTRTSTAPNCFSASAIMAAISSALVISAAE